MNPLFPHRLDCRRPRFIEAKKALGNGASLTDRNVWGETPLYTVAHKSRPDLVKLYLEHGADPNALNQSGLHMLVECANADTVRLLVRFGADTEYMWSGRTLLDRYLRLRGAFKIHEMIDLGMRFMNPGDSRHAGNEEYFKRFDDMREVGFLVLAWEGVCENTAGMIARMMI